MIEVYNPVTYVEHEKAVRTPLVLKGKKVGLLNNSKPNVDLLYNYLAKWIQDRFQTGSVLRLMKANAAQPAPPGIVEKLSEEAQVVINAVGD